MDQIIICNVRIITRLAVPLSPTERFSAFRLIVFVFKPTDLMFWLCLTALASIVYRRSRQLFSSTKL